MVIMEPREATERDKKGLRGFKDRKARDGNSDSRKI